MQITKTKGNGGLAILGGVAYLENITNAQNGHEGVLKTISLEILKKSIFLNEKLTKSLNFDFGKKIDFRF